MEKRLRIVFLSVIGLIVLLTLILKELFDFSWMNSIFLSVILVIAIILISFLQWALRPMGKKNSNYMIKNKRINFRKTRYYYEISSKDQTNNIGVIFYPGGRIVPEAYIPIFDDDKLTEMTIFIVRMPFNMAVFDYSRAVKIIKEQKNIKTWIIGGHSLGGAMAAHLVVKHPLLFAGLFLWGAYPSRRDDMSELQIPILSIFADCDGITTNEKIELSKHLFPDHTKWVIIEGGNHSQFGCYGIEKQDYSSKISPEEQRNKILDATLSFVNEIT